MVRTKFTETIVTQERWQTLMTQFGFESNIETFDKLVAAYSERHRQYHSLAHLKHVLMSFDEVQNLAEQPHEVELALWFHDAVYKIFSSDNELASAKWASKFLKNQGADEEVVQRVYQHIMATLHDGICENSDSGLVVDIDLAILGTPVDIYQDFEQNVRREYRLVPVTLYEKKRKEILQWFLEKENIYHHKFFQDKYEKQARVNLESAINNL